jgi:hypothetical protein
LIGPLRAKTNYLSFPSVKVNQVKKDSTEVFNTTDQAVQLSFKTPPAHISAVFHPAKIESKQKGYLVVTYDASKIKAYGFVANRLYLNIEGQDYQKTLAVSANIDEDFSGLSAEDLKNAPVVNFDAESFDFGDIKQNTKSEHTFMLINTGKKDLIIHDVKTSCGCTAVSPSKNVIPSGESVPLKVVFDSTGKLGKQLKTITVITNDPKKPTSILTIASNVLTQ